MAIARVEFKEQSLNFIVNKILNLANIFHPR